MINAFSRGFAQFILVITEATRNFWENLNVFQYSPFQIAIDILLVAILFYWIMMIFRGSRASNILLGLILLALLFAVSRFLICSLSVGFLIAF